MNPQNPKVVFVTAGGAGMYCGSCMRDNTQVRNLIQKGWDIELVPAYTPVTTDEEDVSIDRVAASTCFSTRQSRCFNTCPVG